MTITLRPEHEKVVTEAMKTGAYRDADEVISRALEILQTSEDWLRDHKQEISEKIENAFAQSARGEYFTAEASRADMESRKAKWKRDRKH
jgi:putative addiction module CopG family antidote